MGTDELRFIDTRAHGVLDYVVGVALVIALSSPWPRRDDLDRREREMFNRPVRA